MSIAERGEGRKRERSLNPSIGLANGDRWFAVHTLSFAEARAQLNLGNQNFRSFLPKRQKTIRHARKLTTVEAAFFPRYLFVALDLHRDRWRSVNGTFGVSSMVMRGDAPHPIPCGVVEALIAIADERGILRFGDMLQVGERVRLMTGPFAEQLAVLEHLDDSGRVRVLLDILGREVSITTERDNVLPVGH
jgi:transcription elongation factor/antiterminator RfaH